MKAIILRLDAPMMSFGSVVVDQHGFTDLFPGLAMLTGLAANALGWHHGDFERLQALQDRLDFAARWDVEPKPSVDYHTVDLGSTKMRIYCWTTRGEREHRAGGPAAKFGIHQRYRHYWEDGLMTIALTVRGEEYPSIEDLVQAFKKPRRPLFIGRKTCLPARPLLDPITPLCEGHDLLTILESVPVWKRNGEPVDSSQGCRACWTPRTTDETEYSARLVYDLRDWANQIPVGSRWRVEGMIGGTR